MITKKQVEGAINATDLSTDELVHFLNEANLVEIKIPNTGLTMRIQRRDIEKAKIYWKEIPSKSRSRVLQGIDNCLRMNIPKLLPDFPKEVSDIVATDLTLRIAYEELILD